MQVGTAVLLASAICWFLITRGDSVRVNEEKNDELFAGAAAPHKLYWRVAHARSDISALTLLLSLTNVLLAAILATLLK
jgi:hypothetical protein